MYGVAKLNSWRVFSIWFLVARRKICYQIMLFERSQGHVLWYWISRFYGNKQVDVVIVVIVTMSVIECWSEHIAGMSSANIMQLLNRHNELYCHTEYKHCHGKWPRILVMNDCCCLWISLKKNCQQYVTYEPFSLLHGKRLEETNIVRFTH